MAQQPAPAASLTDCVQKILAVLIPPKWKFTESLPKLTRTNYDNWECVLSSVLHEHDLSVLVTPDFDIEKYTGTEKEDMDKACASCNRMMSASLDPSIFDLISGTLFKESAHTIVSSLRSLLKKDDTLTHSILKSEAKALKMTDELSIEQYVDKHRALRTRMLSASYPEIQHESTTIKFMIDGLVDNAIFGTYVGGWYCYRLPTTVNELHHRLYACHEHHLKHDAARSLPSTATTPEQNKPTNQGDGRISPRRKSGNRRGRGRWGDRSSPRRRDQTNYRRDDGSSITARDISKIVKFINNLSDDKPASINVRRRTTNANATNTQQPESDDTDHILDAIAKGVSSQDESKYILDSASHPSHVNHPMPEMSQLPIPLTTQTATASSTTSTHKGTLILKTDQGCVLRLPAIYNHDMNSNLISAQELASQYSHVLLSGSKGYIFNTRTKRPFIIGTATCQKGEYVLHANSKPSPTITVAKSTRTMFLPRRLPKPLVYAALRSGYSGLE